MIFMIKSVDLNEVKNERDYNKQLATNKPVFVNGGVKAVEKYLGTKITKDGAKYTAKVDNTEHLIIKVAN